MLHVGSVIQTLRTGCTSSFHVSSVNPSGRGYCGSQVFNRQFLTGPTEPTWAASNLKGRVVQVVLLKMLCMLLRILSGGNKINCYLHIPHLRNP